MALPAIFGSSSVVKTLLGGATTAAGAATGNPYLMRQGAKQLGISNPFSGGGGEGTPEARGQAAGNTVAGSDDDLQRVLDAAFPQGGEVGETPDYIGGVHPNMMGGGANIVSTAQYLEGDELAELVGMNTESLVRVQDRMASVGLLTGTWFPGQVDPRTIGSFKTLLGMANARGWDWDSLLTNIEEDPRMQELLKEGGKQAFVAPTYLAPDYASIAQQVKQVFRQRLGRDPDEGELAQINAEMQGWDREMFDKDVAAARRRHEGVQGGTDQGVDPVARFREKFEKDYKGELDIVDEREDHGAARQNLETSVNTLRQMARGGF